VSVCGLYVRYIEASLPPLCACALFLCRAVDVDMSHVVSGRGLHYKPQPQVWLADATHTFIFILCIARSTRHSESTQRECFCGVRTRSVCCTLHSLPTSSLNFKPAHVQIVPVRCAPHVVTVTAYGHLLLPNFKMAPLLNNNNTVTTAAWCVSARESRDLADMVCVHQRSTVAHWTMVNRNILLKNEISNNFTEISVIIFFKISTFSCK